MQETMLEFASCMREHGVDMPDPDFSGGGARMQFRAGAGGVDPESPTFQKAQEACQEILEEAFGDGPGFSGRRRTVRRTGHEQRRWLVRRSPSRARRGRPRRRRCRASSFPRVGGLGRRGDGCDDRRSARNRGGRRAANLVLVRRRGRDARVCGRAHAGGIGAGNRDATSRRGVGRHPGPVAVRRERARASACSTGRCRCGAGSALGVSDGADVEQLERNLVELGHDPGGMTVDEEFDADTASAVESWQDAIGVPETGAVEPGDAVFLPGPRRVGQLAVSVGAQLQPGMEVLTSHRDGARRPARPRRTSAGAGHGRWEREGGAAVGTRRRRDDRLRRARSPSRRPALRASPGPATVSVVDPTRRAREARRAGRRAGRRLARARSARRACSRCPSRRSWLSAAAASPSRWSRATRERTLTAVETGSFADGYVEIEGKRVAEGWPWWSPNDHRPRGNGAREALRVRRRRAARRLALDRGG